MRTMAKWSVGAVVAVVIAYAAMVYGFPTYTYRFRVIAEVEMADGVKRGSSVIQVSTTDAPNWWPSGDGANTETSSKGQETYVDLGDGRNLVVLLALGQHGEFQAVARFAPYAFFDARDGDAAWAKWARDLSKMEGTRVYAGRYRPTLVTFRNTDDPSSAEVVPFEDPQTVLNGIRAIRTLIELTRDPVKLDLELKLPWLKDTPSLYRAGLIITNGVRPFRGPGNLFEIR